MINRNIIIIISIAFAVFITVYINCSGNADTDTSTRNIIKVPAEYTTLDYPIPDGMINDEKLAEEMIRRKIEHLLSNNQEFWGSIDYGKDELVRAYKDLGEVINNNFPLFSKLDIDWYEYYYANLSSINDMTTYGEYINMLTHTGISLKDAHSEIIPEAIGLVNRLRLKSNAFLENAPVLMTYPISRIDACTVVTEEDRIFISSVLNNDGNPYNLQVGDEIIGFNGVSWSRWVDSLFSVPLPVYSCPAGNDDAFRYKLMLSAVANAVLFDTINIRRRNGDIDTMPTKYYTPAEIGICDGIPETHHTIDYVYTYKDLTYGIFTEHDIGLIELTGCPAGFDEFPSKLLWNPYDTSFSKVFEKAVINLFDTQALIIDLRYNEGGRIEVLYAGLSYILPVYDEIFPFVAFRRSSKYKDNNKALERINTYPWHPLKPNDDKLFYDKPVIVLTGADCVSACDMLVDLLSDYDNITIIGMTPNGSPTQSFDTFMDIPVNNRIGDIHINIPYILFSLKSDIKEQSLAEAVKNQPDIDMWLKSDDIIEGRDTLIDYAIDMINK